MTPELTVLEPAIDPNNRISFLLDWELTMKCNLDCSYCGTGLYSGGHDNSTKHPPIDQCLDAVKFMFEYADLYMSTKPKGIQYVVLNVYGGESLHHPDIVKILEQVHREYELYKDRWHLTVTTTTNAIVSDKILQSILPLIDEFTVSYHTEHTTKQRQQFKTNLLKIAQAGKRVKCVVLMHPTPELFKDATDMIAWLTEHGIRYLPRQLDYATKKTHLNYYSEQVVWFDKLYSDRSHNADDQVIKLESTQTDRVDLADTGRACCGGRQLCKDGNHKSRNSFVDNKFPDWYCSVNHFFLYVKQVNGEVYVNKDCKMNFSGSVGPIGVLSESQKLLETTKQQLKTGTQPIIQCKNYKCNCGLCAPKAKNLENYKSIMKKFKKDKL
jgi:MoaA/NifB/PqqE/SkfB family radical SAM enzyme